jgi:fumarate hydratase class I
MPGFVEWGLELIRRASSDLSPDVETVVRRGRDAEPEGSTARNVLDSILQNVTMSRTDATPICQDTGLTTFFVHLPRGYDAEAVRADLVEAIRQATIEGILRPNSVHPITGKNTGDNVGVDLPHIEFEPAHDDAVTIDLLLKGGGSENCGAQYRLPDASIKAGRDLDGVERCVIDMVHKAQGQGCAPGILGVCIGGDRAGSYMGAKRQLLRHLDDANPDPQLADMESRLLEKCNRLGIGPMGFGGVTTLLGVKIGWMHRHPASFFVSIAYCCWADRRRRLVVRDGIAQVL